MAAPIPHYTAQEIRQFDDPRLRFEVIRGELFVSPAPGTAHQRAVRELLHVLHDYVTRHGVGEAIAAPYEVEFADDSVVQADILVVLEDGQHRLTEHRVYGPPALVVEVVSYSSKRTDRLQKRQLYLDEGVEQYWVVDTNLRRVECWTPGDSAPAHHDAILTWNPLPTLPPLSIDLHDLFSLVLS